MKKYALLILILISILKLYGQEVKTLVEGKVSYITTQNIYVKFKLSGVVQAGDTIFIRKEEKLIPLLVAESVSSTSCVGKPIVLFELKIDDAVFARSKISEKKINTSISESTAVATSSKQQDSSQPAGNKVPSKPERVSKIRGRLSESSYSSFSNATALNQRYRLTFSLATDNIAGSKFSTDTYVMFTYKPNHWNEVKDNVFSSLKIYSLSVKYDLNPKTHFLLGRNINPRLASVGAIDGLQAETSAGNFTFGAVGGSNPDYTDYSFNPNLFEYGTYLSYDIKNNNGPMSNSFAFLQQTNHGKTDRRFAYFQHENSLMKNLNLFASAELDLFALENGVPVNKVSLTSLFLSLQYRFSRKLSLFASYDARKNIIYYETFRTYLDQLLVDVTRQGYQFRVNYIPAKFINTGLSGGYRFQKNDPHPMLNANGYLNFPQVPLINASVSLSTNWMNTSYVDGLIYGIRVYRDLIPAKLSTGIFYRLADNHYLTASSSMVQHMAEFELSWQISRKISFSANYDGTYDQMSKYHSVYLNLIKRF
ncbi:MAG: hypothetical protein WCI54_16910 [Bacteroidia bacterium]|jgi:hypothetical protein